MGIDSGHWLPAVSGFIFVVLAHSPVEVEIFSGIDTF
jgi:hypothetical protein